VSDISHLQHECPMCGEMMRLKTHERLVQIPGLPEVRKHEVTEWECPECDYFEEYDAKESGR
jgi:C4-type Zn-finger protein